MSSLPAYAQNPFQLFIQPERQYQPQRQWAPPRYDNRRRYYDNRRDYYDRRHYYRRNYDRNDGWAQGRPEEYEPERSAPRRQARERPAPDITVKSPQYVTYVPDKPKQVSLDKVCQLEVASNAQTTPIPSGSSFGAACATAQELSLRVLPEVGTAINDYYSKHPQFLWVEDGALNDKARAVMAALALSGRYGLKPADYRVALPAGALGDTTGAATAENGNHLKAMLRFELALSAKVLSYVLDATRGRVDPNRMSEYYDLPRKKVDLVAAMGEIAKSEDVAGYLDSRNPDNPQFRALVAALAKQRAAAPKHAITIPADTFIRPGESDPALPQVIAAIRESGTAALKEKHADTLAAYGGGEAYDRTLVALVRDFQRGKGLNADGVIGPKTVQAMKQATPADRIKKLTLAMERLRWLPRQLGSRYVLLNEPAFKVKFVRGDGEPVTMRAIVGKPKHQTYFFADTIESVEYNPYWNVPRSIIVNEMLPHLYNDPSYLDRKGYEVTNAAGRQVSSADIDWAAYARKRVSAEVRQPPGRGNALGQLKIEFPNKHAIYMHDTPQKHLFKNQRLAFSHGCVRLEQPPVMAAALLGKPVSYVKKKIAAGQNVSEQVPGDIPVYLTYFTAWPDDDGSVHYYADVYDRDRHLSDALAKTEAVRERSDS